MLKKIKIIFVLTMIITLFSVPVVRMHNLAYAEDSKLQLDDMIEKTYKYYRNKKTDLSSWNEIVALVSVGEDVTESPWELPKWKSEDLDQDNSALDYAGYILGMMAKGEDPSSIWDRNLIEELEKRQQPNGAFDTINGHIWAIIALDASDADYDRAGAIEYLISQQKDDGGYAYGDDDTPEAPSEPDMTGMALVALSNHKDVEGVEKTIEKALNYLKENQLSTGGFESWGNENANSIAAVISGLVALEEDVLSEYWIKDGNTMLDALQRFMLEDGSFTYTLNPKEPNDMATYQAFIALNDLKNGRSIWNTLNITSKDDLKDTDKEKNFQSSESKDNRVNIYAILTALIIVVIICLFFHRMQIKKDNSSRK